MKIGDIPVTASVRCRCEVAAIVAIVVRYLWIDRYGNRELCSLLILGKKRIPSVNK